MLVLLRGQTTFTEVPDAPTGGSSIPRGNAASSASQSADVGEGSFQFSGATVSNASLHDSTPIFSSASAAPQSGAAPQLLAVSSVVTELQGSTVSLRGGDLPNSGGGGAAIGRGDESLAPMSLAWADSSDNGWFIVPSAANEYGEAYAAADGGFTWDVAAGEFAADFFFV